MRVTESAGYGFSEVQTAKQLQADLEATLDVVTYRLGRDALEASAKARREEIAKGLEAKAVEIRGQAKEIRAGEVSE